MKTILFSIIALLVCTEVNGQTNELQIGIGYAGADGSGINPVYEVTYVRHLTKVWGLYGTYALSANQSSSNSDIYQGTKYIGANNTATDPVAKYEQWVSYSLGIQADVVRYTASTLSIMVGVRGQHQERNYFSRSGSNPDDLRVRHLDTAILGVELGIGYSRRLSQHFSVGGKLYAMPADFLFGGALTASVAF